jgi:phosphohistidine phosphatase SixA
MTGSTALKMMAAMCIAVLMAMTALPAHAQDNTAALWSAVKQGRAFAMMRHALAPGTGDPANFDVNDCSTQRNLNDVGRDQARRTGDAFRKAGIEAAQVMTSAWCRCQETARLLNIGEPAVLPPLNSFFRRGGEVRERQTAELAQWLSARQPGAALVLVTHQVNISGLTGKYASSGEIVVVDVDVSDGVKVLGSIPAL